MKKFLKLLLVLTLILSMLASCNFLEDIPLTNGNGGDNDGNDKITDESGDDTKEDNKYKDYSELYQYFMDEFQGEKFFSTDIPENVPDNCALPFSFLESQGYTEEELIKATGSDCTTCIFDSEPNNLYMFVRVAQGDYYDMYILRYTLTDQEIKEYKAIYPKSYCTYAGKQYNNAVSAVKEETIISHYKASKGLMDVYTTTAGRIMYDYDPITNVAQCYVYDKTKGNTSFTNMPLTFISSNIYFSNNTLTGTNLNYNNPPDFVQLTTSNKIQANTFNWKGKAQTYINPTDPDILDLID